MLLLQWPKQLNAPLEEIDPEIADIIELEKARQWKVYIGFLVLISFSLIFACKTCICLLSMVHIH